MIRSIPSSLNRLARRSWIAIGVFAIAASPASAEVSPIRSDPNAPTLDGAGVSGDTELLFLSGQLPSPIHAAKPMRAAKTLEEMGDSKTQTISTLNKIKVIAGRKKGSSVAARMHRLPPGLRKKTLLAHYADGDRRRG